MKFLQQGSSSIKRFGFYGLLMLLIIAGCGDDDRSGVEFEMPQDPDLAWEYDLYEIGLHEEKKVGSLRTENFEITDHEFRPEVLRQRKYIRLDSLFDPRSREQNALIYSTYLDEGDDKFELVQYAGNFYRIYDTALSDRVLDTLTTDDPEGPEFQQFADYEPEWLTIYRFDEASHRNYEIHENQTFHLDFHIRGQHITGSVDVRTTGLYRRTEHINVPWRDNVKTHKINVFSHMEFDVMRDSVQVPEFRETIKMKNWYHPDAGLIRRVREPVTITVPGIPARWPSVFDPGERWELTELEGMDF